jgi:hypothetical protein
MNEGFIKFGALDIIIGAILFEHRLFEQFVRYFDQYLDMISLPFILGFYVATVAAR